MNKQVGDDLSEQEPPQADPNGGLILVKLVRQMPADKCHEPVIAIDQIRADIVPVIKTIQVFYDQ